MGKQSSKTSTVYGNTTTKNPYVQSHTDNNGTTTSFIPGTALDTIYKFVNKNVGNLLDEYLNPNINSVTNQAKLNSFTNTLNSSTYDNLENGIINPLSNRRMVRSSQATDMYKNLENQNVNSISNYLNNLIAESQNNTASMLNTLLSAYLGGEGITKDNQKQSLSTSSGNATHTQSSKSTSQLLKDIQAATDLGSSIASKFIGVPKL